MPGILALSQVLEQVNLDTMRLFLGGTAGDVHEMRDLVSWKDEDEGMGDGEQKLLQQMSGMKKTIAEFAAVVGPRVAKEIVVDFSRG